MGISKKDLPFTKWFEVINRVTKKIQRIIFPNNLQVGTSDYESDLTIIGNSYFSGTAELDSYTNTSRPIAGSAGRVIYNSTSGDLNVDNGFTWSPTNSTSDIVSVTQYGAAGDGVTDDTAAFQAAMIAATGGTLYIPVGFYLLSDTIVQATNTIVRGAGFNTQLNISHSGTAWDFPTALLIHQQLLR